MKVLILGDVHGDWGELNIVLARAMRLMPDIDVFIQVGDFSYAWPGAEPFKFLPTFWENAPLEAVQKIPFYWIDGNHENHDQLDKDSGALQAPMIYQPRGSIREFLEGKRVMFFGGASSIDKAMRIEGRSWWQQESITYGQVLKALEQPGPIDLMISHEHPSGFAYCSYKGVFGKGDKDALAAIRDHFRPRFWVFGHHHYFKQGEHDGTQWACAPIITSRQAILWNGTSLKLLDLNHRI